jgi:hypothetical protein
MREGLPALLARPARAARAATGRAREGKLRRLPRRARTRARAATAVHTHARRRCTRTRVCACCCALACVRACPHARRGPRAFFARKTAERQPRAVFDRQATAAPAAPPLPACTRTHAAHARTRSLHAHARRRYAPGLLAAGPRAREPQGVERSMASGSWRDGADGHDSAAALAGVSPISAHTTFSGDERPLSPPAAVLFSSPRGRAGAHGGEDGPPPVLVRGAPAQLRRAARGTRACGASQRARGEPRPLHRGPAVKRRLRRAHARRVPARAERAGPAAGGDRGPAREPAGARGRRRRRRRRRSAQHNMQHVLRPARARHPAHLLLATHLQVRQLLARLLRAGVHLLGALASGAFQASGAAARLRACPPAFRCACAPAAAARARLRCVCARARRPAVRRR